nr:MAG TPA: hypothetical protein [Caudoviricetes sp.]DAQ65836.1 MAG TPA: hypothetical protein [Caudoviricetes sp.]DAW76793.1 MAG TPA: hypothetical protein [Caudoviricetes sp.]
MGTFFLHHLSCKYSNKVEDCKMFSDYFFTHK